MPDINTSLFGRAPWLLFEFAVLVALSVIILGYSGADSDYKLMSRGFVAFSLCTFFIGHWHALTIVRNNQKKLNCWWVFIVFRMILVAIFIFWMTANDLLGNIWLS